jgi:glycosyltransferase involved in cell wall biosynthesis
MKKLLVIPTYHCEVQIGRLLRKSGQTINEEFQEVLIIDNGSTDKTIENAINGLKSIEIPIKVLQNIQNLSLGGSLKTGFLYAKNNSFDFVVVLHGDDQAQIKDLGPVFKDLENHNIDLGIGARFHPNSDLIGYSLFRKIGNRLLNLYCIICTGKKIDDLIAGLNIFRVSELNMDEILTFPNDLTFDVHILLRAINQKQNIKFFPITWTEEDQVSNAKVIKQALTILGLLTKYFFTKEKALHFAKSEFSYLDYNVLFEKS